MTATATASKGWRRARMLLLCAVIFFSGVCLGGALTVRVLRTRVPALLHNPQAIATGLVNQMDRALDLSDEQRVQVEAIVAARMDSVHALRQEIRPKVAGQLEAFHSDIAAILTPEQKAQWDTRYQDALKRWLPPLDDNQ